jgi:uracil-DNA glycosylase family 4
MARLFPESTFVAPTLIEGSTRLCVAEAPGELEAERGEALVGTSGSWLFGKEDEKGRRSGGLYRAAGVDPSSISKCNTLQCRPPKNVYPTDAEARTYISKEDADAAVQQCLNNHVKPLLASRNWNRIDLLGDKALRGLTDRTGGILRWRGSPTTIPACRPEPIAVPTLHPAFIARNQELLPAVIADLKKTLDQPEEHYNTTPELEVVRAFTATEFAFDIETVWGSNRITMVGLCAESTKALCVPAVGAYLPELKRIFENATDIVAHNGIQFDVPRLFNLLGLEWKPDYSVPNARPSNL